MKLAYYVSDIAQDNSDHEVHNSGDHEVHNSGCPHFDRIQSKTYLGLFDNCAEAVIEAKKKYDQSNGCYWCCNDCHMPH